VIGAGQRNPGFGDQIVEPGWASVVRVGSPANLFDDAPICAHEVYPKRNAIAIVDAYRLISQGLAATVVLGPNFGPSKRDPEASRLRPFIRLEALGRGDLNVRKG
jgi:hypothetical protein